MQETPYVEKLISYPPGEVPESIVQHALRLAGDPHPLIAFLGVKGKRKNRIYPPIKDCESYLAFLDWYTENLFIPIEAPSIIQAAEHLHYYRPRELIALDAQLSNNPILKQYCNTSRVLTLQQLRRLSPMRDQKIVRIYQTAIENHQANGWHFLIYGIVLGLFYIPYRQGLIAYAKHTYNYFSIAARDRIKLPDKKVIEITNSKISEIISHKINPIIDALHPFNEQNT